jgi:lipopolysaccharide/colanic/teichoic acid biosynthesis glycosyltransferase
MRNYLRLAIDLAWAGLAALLAALIRDNLVFSVGRLQEFIPYALISVASAAVVFTLARLHRTMWRYTSLPDVVHLVTAVTIALILGLIVSFALNRLDDVPRSVPVIHWFVLIAALIGTRAAARLRVERASKATKLDMSSSIQHILLVGENELTELYLSSIAKFASSSFIVAGIVCGGQKLQGRSLRQHRVLGKPEELSRVLANLELHGVIVDRIVVTEPFEQLSKTAREALLDVERSSATRVEWLLETLGWELDNGKVSPNPSPKKSMPLVEKPTPKRPHEYLKRGFDLILVLLLSATCSPLLLAFGVIVAIDVGWPVVFWQWRPGRNGRPFKLYKLRTMRAAHDRSGYRIPDELRSSRIGSVLRKSRLDELPQLFNILIGEMSFVGPRPLLPADQPQEDISRLAARPGLTGWAQVNGGRDISAEEKAALDLWYIQNASLRLDIAILLRTLKIVIFGDGVDGVVLTGAGKEREEPRTISAEAECSSISLTREPRAA